jgi:hypothetical protein
VSAPSAEVSTQQSRCMAHHLDDAAVTKHVDHPADTADGAGTELQGS